MSKIKDINLRVGGMHCASCAATIERGLSSAPGVEDCSVNLATASARINYESDQTDVETIISRIEKLGYEASPGTADILTLNNEQTKSAARNAILAFIFSLPLAVLSMYSMISGELVFTAEIDGAIQALLAALALFVAGRNIVQDAFRQTLRFRANMNSLIAMGSLTAFSWSCYALYLNVYQEAVEMYYFESVGMIISLILLGRYFESRSRGRAGEAIRSLLKLRPSKTTAIINNVEIEIDSASAAVGMTLLVKPGERVPADGVIIEGNPTSDEALLTGESLPVEKKVGDSVIGGALNGNIPFKMTVNTPPDKSFLASVIRLVSEAQSKKAPVQGLADRIAAVFVPVVIGLATLTFIAWYYYDPSSPMLIRSVISILIIACPCALGLATPTAILAGTGRAATSGIIIRGGDILESITNLNTIIFDKTGTLTHGALEVVEIKTFGQYSQRNMVRMAGSAETQSEHPVAKAVVKYMEYHQISPGTIKNVVTLPGFGLKAEFDGHPLIVGNKSLMENEGIYFGPAVQAGDSEMLKGRTVIFAAVDRQIAGLIALTDKLRTESREVVDSLKERGLVVSMISGDNRKTAAGVASSIGIEEFEAEIRPDQKKYIVETFVRSGNKVAMVGDGVNDAPALAMADVGIAIGSGTDVAMEAADVVLVRPDLRSVLQMLKISDFSLKIIRQNLFWAFFYNILAIPVAAGLFYPLFGWSLSPVLAATAMAFSSVFVVTNSLRINRLEL